MMYKLNFRATYNNNRTEERVHKYNIIMMSRHGLISAQLAK